MTCPAEDVPAGVAKLFGVDPDPAETVATYLRGDRKAYDAIDPLKIRETARFGGGATAASSPGSTTPKTAKPGAN